MVGTPIAPMRARARDGLFITRAEAVQYQAKAAKMKAALLRDVRAVEHARGVVFEKRHFHALPVTAKPRRPDPASNFPTLFDQEAA